MGAVAGIPDTQQTREREMEDSTIELPAHRSCSRSTLCGGVTSMPSI